MMCYAKKEDDVKYRRINTANLEEEEFVDFTSDYVDYYEGCVLEVMRRDGTTHIEYGQERRTVRINADGDCLYFPLDLPRARLWLKDLNGIFYKVPAKLLERERNAYVQIPGGLRNIQLCGDPYFEAVYELRGFY